MRMSFAEYEDFKNKQGKNMPTRGVTKGFESGVRIDKLTISPHARALAVLQRKPDLLVGSQEHYMQVAVFNFLELHHPDIYDLTYSMPNAGKRSKKTAVAMKAEGQKAGYPDVGLDAARGVYHGFRCELKIEKGKPQPNQNTYATKLRDQGYCVVFCYGFDAVVKAFLEYWNLDENGEMVSDSYK
jgi:hypothetical protein